MSLHPRSRTLRERLREFFESLGRTQLQRSADGLGREDRQLPILAEDTLGPCRTDLEVNRGNQRQTG